MNTPLDLELLAVKYKEPRRDVAASDTVRADTLHVYGTDGIDAAPFAGAPPVFIFCRHLLALACYSTLCSVRGGTARVARRLVLQRQVQHRAGS